MESTGTTIESFSNSGGTAVVATQTRQFQGIKVQNPFAFKVGQVFTGFGVGCGVGIGVGRPINMGAIPVVNQVMSATSGATHAFSGVTRYVNDALRKVGAKNIEAGIGCGVGFGHGFGIGVALKPGVINQVQSTVVQLMTKMMMKFGISPNLSIGQGALPTSIQSSMGMMVGSLNQNPPGNMMQLSPTSQKTSQLLPGYGNMPMGSFPGLASNSSQVEPPDVTRTEMVLNKFLNDPVLKQGDAEIYNLVGSLRSENSMMQMVLKHQQVIEELKDENEKLRHILVEDLKVHPSKMQASNSPKYDKSPCTDCFECRRKQRRRR